MSEEWQLSCWVYDYELHAGLCVTNCKQFVFQSGFENLSFILGYVVCCCIFCFHLEEVKHLCMLIDSEHLSTL